MRKCAPACACALVCVGLRLKGKTLCVRGCCIFDELAPHNGPVEGCGGSFQSEITRQVSASTFKGTSYNNFSKKKKKTTIFLRAAESTGTINSSKSPLSCCVTQHTFKGQVRDSRLQNDIPLKIL